jgi:hypothetical protein
VGEGEEGAGWGDQFLPPVYKLNTTPRIRGAHSGRLYHNDNAASAASAPIYQFTCTEVNSRWMYTFNFMAFHSSTVLVEARINLVRLPTSNFPRDRY